MEKGETCESEQERENYTGKVEEKQGEKGKNRGLVTLSEWCQQLVELTNVNVVVYNFIIYLYDQMTL